MYETATSGAAATIASDAFMNPFDGTVGVSLLMIYFSSLENNL